MDLELEEAELFDLGAARGGEGPAGGLVGDGPVGFLDAISEADEDAMAGEMDDEELALGVKGVGMGARTPERADVVSALQPRPGARAAHSWAGHGGGFMDAQARGRPGGRSGGRAARCCTSSSS